MADTLTPVEESKSFLQSLIPFFIKSCTISVGLVSILLGILYAKQDHLLYFPEIQGLPRKPGKNPKGYRSPAEHKVRFESHRIPCADGVSIHAWLLLYTPLSVEQDIPVVLFFHGNAGNIGLRLPNAARMVNELRAHVLLVEYRGYGDSDDAMVCEKGLKLDAEAALRFARERYSRIIVFGRSLGGAVGFHLARHAESLDQPLAGLVVENTFTSISGMVDVLMPAVAWFKPLVLRIRWDSLEIAPRLRKTPILYLAGSDDQLVPHDQMLTLYRASKQAASSSGGGAFARLHIIEGGTHNDSWLKGGNLYWKRFQEFIAETHLTTTAATTTPSVALPAVETKIPTQLTPTNSSCNMETVVPDDWTIVPGVDSQHQSEDDSSLAVSMGVEASIESSASSGGISSIPIPDALMSLARHTSTSSQKRKTN